MESQETSKPVLESWDEPISLRWTTPYLKRLLIERHYIRASLENPGGSIIASSTAKVETDSLLDYSTVIGNDFHLDLLAAEDEVNTLRGDERARLLAWCDGLSPQVAAEYASIRPGVIKARQRILKRMVEDLNDAGENT